MKSQLTDTSNERLSLPLSFSLLAFVAMISEFYLNYRVLLEHLPPTAVSEVRAAAMLTTLLTVVGSYVIFHSEDLTGSVDVIEEDFADDEDEILDEDEVQDWMEEGIPHSDEEGTALKDQ